MGIKRGGDEMQGTKQAEQRRDIKGNKIGK